MLTLTILTVVSGIALALAVTISEDGHYNTRYNHLDIERILNNKRLVTYYAQCLTGEGPCTPQGTDFKRILPEALRTNCLRCTEKQKHTAYQAIRRLKKEYPRIWQQLHEAWDPTGEFVSRFVRDMEAARPATPGAELDNEITGEAPARLPLPRAPTEQPTSAIPNTQGTQRTTIKSTITTTQNGPLIVSLNNQARQTTTSTTNKNIPVVLSRGGPEIQSTSTSDINNQPTQTTTTTVRTTTPNINRLIPSSARPTVTVTDTNYRTSYRPTRVNILFPRPHEFGRLTANVIGSIGDIGTKVIRTGARIADMVLTGVQAGVQATIGRIQQ